ncbi:MAG: hypothetical protein ACLQMT_04035 [Candidatus Acidiferrales bacterium]
MIELILFLLVGALLLFSLLFFAPRNAQGQKDAEPLAQVQHALNVLQLGLLAPEIVGRIFAKGDFDYVVSETSAEIQKLFLEERRRLALSWVGQVRRQIVSLRRFHLGSARFYARLRFLTEMRLAWDFATLLFACRALQAAVYLRGPYAAPRLVGATAAAAARVCGVSEKSLDFLRPARVSSFGDDSAGGSAV